MRADDEKNPKLFLLVIIIMTVIIFYFSVGSFKYIFFFKSLPPPQQMFIENIPEAEHEYAKHTKGATQMTWSQTKKKREENNISFKIQKSLNWWHQTGQHTHTKMIYSKKQTKGIVRLNLFFCVCVSWSSFNKRPLSFAAHNTLTFFFSLVFTYSPPSSLFFF